MSPALARLTGAARADGQPPSAVDWLRALVPLAAPLVIVVSGEKGGALLSAALAWMALMVPGWLAVNRWFPKDHPLGAGASRLGVASMISLFPFCLCVYPGYILHWRLTTVLMFYAVVYVAIVGLLGWSLVKRPAPRAEAGPPEPFDPRPVAPRWLAAFVLVAIAVVFVGVCMSSPDTHAEDAVTFNPAKRPGWWHGAATASVASLIGAAAVAYAFLRRQKKEPDKPEAKAAPRSSRAKPKRRAAPSESLAWLHWLVAPLWVASALFALHLMRSTYSESYAKMEDLARGALSWNVDDVAYVSEAVDIRYGAEMGRYETSVGGNYAHLRASMSFLSAPLVATLSMMTGLECAALHHSVMPPLVVLVGVSCYAAALMIVFRMHRWLVPLGLLVTLILVFKTWDYARCVVEMLIYRAMQSKALHLWWLAPLQVSSAVLAARRPGGRHLAYAAVIAVVAHFTHPLATIMGVIIGGSATLVAFFDHRRGALHTAALMLLYCGLAGEFYAHGKTTAATDLPRLTSGRKAGEPLQSRDLVRTDVFKFSLGSEFAGDLDGDTVTPVLARAFREHDISVQAGFPIAHEEEHFLIRPDRRSLYRIDPNGENFDVYQVAAKPRLRHDPFWTFGCNTLYLIGCLAIPFVFALGVRRRELLYVGALGAIVLACTNFEPLGRLLNTALPASIFWRARWMVPTFINAAALAAVIVWAVNALIRGRDGQTGDGRNFIATALAAGAFGLLVANTGSRAVEVGKAPAELTKFPSEIHELVEKLGGKEASPFVWGTFLVHHELPQLMPNVRLVFSRDKLMRPSDDENYRLLVTRIFEGYGRGWVEPRAYDRMFELYPIDHVVVDRGYRDGAKKLAEYLTERGWRRIGTTSRGRYEVWRSPTIGSSPAPTS